MWGYGKWQIVGRLSQSTKQLAWYS